MGKFKTPLRYPGGKQKLWPFIEEVITVNELQGGHYVEPYAGGAGVAMELLLGKVVSCIHLNDSSAPVFSFWHAVLNTPEELCRKISRASLTIKEWRKQQEIVNNPKGICHLDLGFAMFYLNRCNRSGILNAGVIGGLMQDGQWKMDARFSRNELIRRIEAIADRRNSIKIRNWDAERFIKDYVSKLPQHSLIYCDPPYFNKADKLYMNHYTAADHVRIAKVIQKEVRHPWLVSYDNASPISTLYKKRRTFFYSLQYNAAKVYKGEELFIVSDGLVLPKKSIVPTINIALNRELSAICA